MEPKVTQFSIISKKKNYDTVTDPELADQLSTIDENITYVSLSGNSYSITFCEEFSSKLKELKRLETANFNDIFVGRKKDEIPKSLEHLTTPFLENQVRALDLSNNAVGPNGSQAISGYLKNASGLRVFHINNCGLGIQGATTLAEALKEGNVQLEVISMARNRLEDKGAIAIASALEKMTSIREVHLFQNVIREEGMVPLLTALTGKPELETLDIRDNFINEKSIDVFCNLLEKTPSLKNLNISDCNMELDLAKRVVDALEKSPAKFEKLGFNYNDLSDTEYAKKLLNVLLEKNPGLKRLDIKGNDFKKGAQAYYNEKAKEQIKYYGFESDDENEEDELIREFTNLRV